MPRSAQTKQLLAQSLQQLMLTTPLEKISVNDIVDNAGVGRNTFYYHFEDKYDLVNWYFQSGVTQFLMERSGYSDFQSMLEALEEYFRENKVFYTNALQYTGQNCLAEYIFGFLDSLYRQRGRDVLQENDPDVLAFHGHFLAGAVLGVLLPWVNGGMKEHLPLNQLHLQQLIHDVPDHVLGVKSSSPEDSPLQ